MRVIEFDREQEVPIVRVLIEGPRSVKRATLVFDTGSGITQIHTSLIEAIGYSARDGQRRFSVKGVVGDPKRDIFCLLRHCLYLVVAMQMSVLAL